MIIISDKIQSNQSESDQASESSCQVIGNMENRITSWISVNILIDSLTNNLKKKKKVNKGPVYEREFYLKNLIFKLGKIRL